MGRVEGRRRRNGRESVWKLSEHEGLLRYTRAGPLQAHRTLWCASAGSRAREAVARITRTAPQERSTACRPHTARNSALHRMPGQCEGGTQQGGTV